MKVYFKHSITSTIIVISIVVKLGSSFTLPKPIIKTPTLTDAPPMSRTHAFHPYTSAIRTELNAMMPMPMVPPEVLTSFLPPILGFVKSEWTVSYGYGFATALGGLAIWLGAPGPKPINPVFPFHAAALIFYGLRLNLFLFIRNRTSARIKEFQKTIEERAQERGNRLSRAPFIVSCGLLYYGLVLPVLFTSKLGENVAPAVGINVMKALVGLQWLGYLVATAGDLTKTYVKEREKDGKFLVTSGVYSILRHPNFTGEIVSWTCSYLTGTLAAAYMLFSSKKLSLTLLSQWAISLLGWVGIVFVLLRATQNLEDRQQREYGDTEKYKKWVQSTWSGWKLSIEKATSPVAIEITMDGETEEASGTGI